MFESEMRQFTDNLSALREFVEVVEPVLESRRLEGFKENPSTFAPLALLMHALQPDKLPMEDSVKAFIEEEYQCEVNVIDNDDSGHPKSATITISGSNEQQFVNSVDRFRRRTYHSELLYQNSLVSLVSMGEWFLSQILHKHFDQYPETAQIDDKQLKFKDLRTFGTVQVALQYVVDSRVEEILRGSFSDWIEFLRTHLKLSMGYLDDYQDSLVEICQRRNLLVHNAGYKNEIYRSKVTTTLREDEPDGARVMITRDYLENAITQFERAFILIAAELWKKMLLRMNIEAKC